MQKLNPKQPKIKGKRNLFIAATPCPPPALTTPKYNHQDKYRPTILFATAAQLSRSTVKLATTCIKQLTHTAPTIVGRRQPPTNCRCLRENKAGYHDDNHFSDSKY